MSIEILEDTSTDVDLDIPWEIVLYNDDHTEFFVVIAALIDACKHSEDMAIKIAVEAHKRGKSIADCGDKDEMQKRKDKLQNYGLTVELQQV